MENDLISRQDVIKAINKALDRETFLYSFVRKIAIDAVRALPSVHPDVPDTNVGDTIFRKAAIDALCEEPQVWSGNDDYGQGLNNQWHYDVNALKKVPSAQPDLSEYSDKLWKAAYERGKADAQQGWIPVTERLPDESKWYLISNGLDSWVAIWSKENKEWLSVTGLDYTITDVVAWMEFPEPYREEGNT